MTKMFYDIATELDEYKGLQNINDEQLNTLLKYLENDSYATYFFNDLENPTWVLPLYEKGIFAKIPPPLEDPANPGYFSMPTWYPGEYLKRMADQFPEVVKDVALSLETDNSRAIRTMLEALVKIPANITAETVDEFRRWLETPFANFMMLSHELGIAMEYLAQGEQVEAALTVLDVLLEPIQVKDRFEEGKIIAGTRHDYFWLNEALEKNLPALTQSHPTGVIGTAEKQLMKAIELEHDPRINNNAKKLNSYWRLSISPRSDANYENEIKNLLVNTVIGALDSACEKNVIEATEILTRYIDSDFSIFRRIANYVLRTWGPQHKVLLERTYNRYKSEPIRDIRPEFDKLIEIQFANLPELVQKEIIHERMTPDPEWVKDLLENRSDRFIGETVEEKRQTIIERLQLEALGPLSPHLEDGDKEYYEYLQEKHGEPSPRPESGVVVTSWEGPESPIEIEQLGKKSVEAVVQDLLNYVPSSDESFGEPSREGLARTLETDVQSRAGDYAAKATLFTNGSLPFVYHTHLLRGLENAVKNQEKLELTSVIPLCEFIVSQEQDQFRKQEYEEGLPAAKLAIVHFLEELFRVREPYIADDLLEKCSHIIVDLLHQQEPFPYKDDAQGFDPATHSLNCLHGVAMHSLVAYGLYCERKRKKEMGDKGNPVMIPIVKETITENLDKTNNPSLAVHSVFGWYYPQFIYLDREWALDKRDKVFPSEAELAKYWQAAWSAYIRFSDVYTNVFPELINQYQRALEDFSILDKKQGLDRTAEKMATHILKAYLLDMIRLDTEDGLMHLYYQKADDETRSGGNFWLSQALASQQPSAEDLVWQKIWSLWQWRVEKSIASDDRSIFTKEINNFCRLLKNTPLELPELYSILQRTLEFKPKGFEVQLIIEYLGENCEKYPDLAVSMLHEIVLSRQILYLVTDTEKSVEKIIMSVVDADKEAKAKAIEIINIFGEHGDYKWRPFLDKIGEVA
jgi:hypothetical protein